MFRIVFVCLIVVLLGLVKTATAQQATDKQEPFAQVVPATQQPVQADQEEQEEPVLQQSATAFEYTPGPFEKAAKRALKKDGWRTGGLDIGGFRSHIEIRKLDRNKKPFAPHAPEKQNATHPQTQHNDKPETQPDNRLRLVALSTFRDCKECPEMVVLPASFSKQGAMAISRYEITHAGFRACVKDKACQPRHKLYGPGTVNMNQHISRKADELPQTYLRGMDVVDYVRWLRDKTGQDYLLPSRQQWQKAANAQHPQYSYPWGENFKQDKAACRACRKNGLSRIVAVDRFEPNALGLYGMAGNVAEWIDKCTTPQISLNSLLSTDVNNISAACEKGVMMGGSWLSGREGIMTHSEQRADFNEIRHDAGIRVMTRLPNIVVTEPAQENLKQAGQSKIIKEAEPESPAN